MRDFIASRPRSFRYAFSGWWHVLKTQKNTRIHALATACVIALAIWLKLSTLEWGVLIIAIGLVWAAECINTAIEALVDLVSPEYNRLAGIAKDTGAAGVLVCAITAAILGFLVMGPPLWKIVSSWF